jgi:hypothetical protein
MIREMQWPKKRDGFWVDMRDGMGGVSVAVLGLQV